MKIVKRIALGILFALLGIILFFIVSIPLAGMGNAERIAAVTNTTLPGVSGNPNLRAYVARPTGPGPFPVVIMIHEFFGLNESITSKADGLAEEGYVVIAPDTFRGATSPWIPRAIYQVVSTPPEQVNLDLDTVFAWVEAQPDLDVSRVGIAGFCYGGRASLAYSLHNPRIAATVIFYGSPETDPALLKTLPGPVLGIFGGADTSIPLEDVQSFETGLAAANIPHEITIYEGQPHAFMLDMNSIRAGGIQYQAWNQMVQFLEINLKNRVSSPAPAQTTPYTAQFDWRYYAMLVYEHAFGTASGHH